MIPGEYLIQDGEITLNADREAISSRSQHRRSADSGRLALPFLRVQPRARFERERARGYRLDIPAGTAVRFEPGQTRDVQLVPIAGARVIYGFNGLVMGPLEPGEPA